MPQQHNAARKPQSPELGPALRLAGTDAPIDEPVLHSEPPSTFVRWDFDAALAMDKQLSKSALRLVLLLASYFNLRRGDLWPSINELSSRLGVGRRTVEKAMAELYDRGFARTVRKAGDGHASTTRALTVPPNFAGRDPAKTTVPPPVNTAGGDRSCSPGAPRPLRPDKLCNLNESKRNQQHQRRAIEPEDEQAASAAARDVDVVASSSSGAEPEKVDSEQSDGPGERLTQSASGNRAATTEQRYPTLAKYLRERGIIGQNRIALVAQLGEAADLALSNATREERDRVSAWRSRADQLRPNFRHATMADWIAFRAVEDLAERVPMDKAGILFVVLRQDAANLIRTLAVGGNWIYDDRRYRISSC